MRFQAPYYAIWFWVVAALVVFFAWAGGSRKKAINSFAQAELFASIAASYDRKKYNFKAAMIIAGFICSVIALMRPQWGFQWQEVKRRGLDILVAIDTSKSMLAADVKPNRLERSKLAVQDLVKKLSGDRIGLIAFAGSSYLQCPLTVDYDGFLLALNDISVNSIGRGGTSISSAIDRALSVFKEGDKKYKVLILITDGEDHEGDAIAYAKKAQAAGVKIFTIGIGSSEGELIQVPDQQAKTSFLKDRAGNVVKTRLNEKILEDIAIVSGGMYVRASGANFGLDTIYQQRLSRMEKQDTSARQAKLYHERFQIFVTMALLLIGFEPLISTRKKGNNQ